MNGKSAAAKATLLFTGVFTIHTLALYQGCLLGTLLSGKPYTSPIKDWSSGNERFQNFKNFSQSAGFDDLAELIERGEAVLNLISPEKSINQLLLNASDPDGRYKSIRRALLKNPPVFLVDDSSEVCWRNQGSRNLTV